MVVVVAIIRVNGPTSDQQGLELNTVMLGFLYQDQGEEDDDGDDDQDQGEEDDDGECFGEGQGLSVRELFLVILICDGSTPLESQHSTAIGKKARAKQGIFGSV